MDAKQLLVDVEVGRTLEGWVPRRLGGWVHILKLSVIFNYVHIIMYLASFITFRKGGGFGGKKESGQLRFGGRDRAFRQPM